MTYFADLTPYVYDESDRSRLNVGWLEAGRDYPTGPVEEEFRRALVYLLGFQVNLTRGAHSCQICGRRMIEYVDQGGCSHLLGAAEIHVDGGGGAAFAAPSLIVHYVTEHEYLPPVEFREAVVKFAAFYGLNGA